MNQPIARRDRRPLPEGLGARRGRTIQGPIDAAPGDPWITHRSGYSPDRIYSRATDGNGHSEVLYVKLSPAIMAAVREAVDKIAAYRTPADLVRDSLIHRLHTVNEWPAEHVNLQPVDVEVRRAEVDRISSNMGYWNESIEKLDALLTQVIRDGDYETAQYLIDEWNQVDSMSTPYQMRLGAVIERHVDALSRIT